MGRTSCRSACRCRSGWGWSDWTVAKHEDLLIAAEAVGLVRRPQAEDPSERPGEPRIVVDTSAIIDGRIAEIVKSGFIYGTARQCRR